MRERLTWVPLVVSAVAGVAMQSCVLAASAAIFFAAGFYDRMDRDSPLPPLRCAQRCIIGGLVALAFALFLTVMLLSHFGGAWNPTAENAVRASAVLAACYGLWMVTTSSRQSLRAMPWPAIATATIPAGIIALLVPIAAIPVLAQCLFAAAVTATLLWTAWRLIFGMGLEALRSGFER